MYINLFRRFIFQGVLSDCGWYNLQDSVFLCICRTSRWEKDRLFLSLTRKGLFHRMPSKKTEMKFERNAPSLAQIAKRKYMYCIRFSFNQDLFLLQNSRAGFDQWFKTLFLKLWNHIFNVNIPLELDGYVEVLKYCLKFFDNIFIEVRVYVLSSWVWVVLWLFQSIQYGGKDTV